LAFKKIQAPVELNSGPNKQTSCRVYRKKSC